jgi:UDP-2,4-diacetamido-2,4,6-trideoxy-beta-L-altropyranose hydrolase
MRVAFRADASARIGSGHVMRCLALADELRQRGWETRFLCREQPGHPADLIGRGGHPVSLLPPPDANYAPSGEACPHAAWLGASWETDAAETAARLPVGTDWLVVDHYALDARWESAVASRVGRVLVIDDLADRAHACDCLLDQNLQAPGRYEPLVPRACQILIGPAHALLRPEFHALSRQTPGRDGEVERVLVFFGGGDAGNETGKVLAALATLEAGRLQTDVVVGSANPRKEEIRKRCRDLPGCRFHCPAEDMAGLMARADLALGATGVSTWERACLGLPALAVSVADNQHDIARAADRAGLLRWLGEAGRVDVPAWRRAIAHALASPATLAAQSRTGMALVDGLGTRRVADRMGA